MPYEKKDDELGALWSRTGPKGEYLSGKINGVDVVCFLNRSDNPKAPKWKVLKSQPREKPAQSEADESDFL